MNTINNPLVLKKTEKNDFDERYLVNKSIDPHGNQSGEYVDKKLAKEMLKEMEAILPLLQSYHCQIFGPSALHDIIDQADHPINVFRKAILKAKGE